MNEKCKMKRAAFEEWKIKKHNVDVDILISNQVQSVCSALNFFLLLHSVFEICYDTISVHAFVASTSSSAERQAKFSVFFSFVQLFFCRVFFLNHSTRLEGGISHSCCDYDRSSYIRHWDAFEKRATDGEFNKAYIM